MTRFRRHRVLLVIGALLLCGCSSLLIAGLMPGRDSGPWTAIGAAFTALVIGSVGAAIVMLGRLAGSERALAEAQRLTSIGSFEWNTASDRFKVSAEAERIFGLPEGLGTHDRQALRDRIHFDDADLLRNTFRKYRNRRSSFAVTHRIVRTDGSQRTVQLRGRYDAPSSSAPGTMIGTIQDITAFRRAEERFRSLFENAPHAGVIVDAEGQIALVNSQAERLFGYGREALVGTDVALIVTGLDLGFCLAASDGPVEMSITGRRRDGSRFPLELSASPMEGEGGKLLSLAMRDVTAQRRAADALEHQAAHDSLTELPNRATFLSRLERSIARAAHDGSQLAVMFLDLDDFKLVNDTLGHEAGDGLLLALAPRLAAVLRPGDMIARFGGDEFVVLLEGLTGEREALVVARRIEAAVSRPVVVDGHEHVVTVSVGLAVVADAVGITASDVLADADAAMYQAKAGGKGRVEVFDLGMRACLLERMAVEAELRRGIDRDELRLYYQPVVSLVDGTTVGVEALVRWQHPERGLLEPAAFIGLAEESGLIVPLGEWVMEAACRQAAAWSESFGPSLRMSINLSPRQVSRSDVAGHLRWVIDQTGVDPSRLIFEITESTLFEDGEESMQALRELRSLGAGLVLDDFGTGYSSLSNLKQLAIDALKIDQSFVSGLGRDAEDGAIVNAVLSMARALGVSVTAEGVETPTQLARLREHGCEFVQGYLFGRAVPAEQLEALIAPAARQLARAG